VQLGLENKKKATWAAVLGILAVIAFAYEFIPMFTGSSAPSSNPQAAAPALTPRAQKRTPTKPGKKAKPQNLDPTLRLDLLAASEKTEYQGNGRNIFVSSAEDVVIPKPIAPARKDGNTDVSGPGYQTPTPPQAPPIPLKFYGFASSPGEPKRIFLKLGEDVFVAGEGEIVDRRYKVIRISATSVEIQDVVNSGPPQSIPLTQG
jgi:hypothetical protein